jgi:hypothetical protein
MRFVWALCCLLCVCGTAFALDRETFTFTNYDLNLRVEPEQQRLAVRGRITLRNDSTAPQKSLALQISSTLDWRSIQIDGKPVQFVTHQYTSDIDHTGALSEAIVTLPAEVAPKASLDLDIGYEGVIPLDATRLTRVGLPEDKAKHSDWDQISKSFTAVRGIGYVAWYPIATEAVNLSEADSVADAVGRWTSRHADSEMSVLIESTSDREIFFSGTQNTGVQHSEQSVGKIGSFRMVRPGVSVPAFVIAPYQKLPHRDFLDVGFFSGQQDAAEAYAEVAGSVDPPVGRGSRGLQILSLPDARDVAFVTQGLMLTPLKTPLTNEIELAIVYAIARQMVLSPRAWIQDGLSHYAQAEFVEEQKGRQAALDYLDSHKSVLLQSETKGEASSSSRNRPLISGLDDLYLQVKAMYVWWMLKDMLGASLNAALLSYQTDEDTNDAYMQKLLEKNSRRDLQWFLDDWVCHDRGLPDFRVASVFSSPVKTGGFLVTITVENLGDAGAEVPITLQMETGEIRKRLEVHARSKASLRIEATSAPKQVTINDGSVPESDASNNTFKIESAKN